LIGHRTSAPRKDRSVIRKVLLSTVALAAISGTAFAADLPSRRAPPVYVPPPIPIFSWTGFYVGGQIGYGFGQDNFGGGGVSHPHGVVGGGHVGYNFAGIPGFGLGLGGLVLGVEGDVDGSDYRNPNGFFPSIKTNLQGSARGRLGVAVDRALFYATGGAAFSEFDTGYATGATFSHTRVGWTVGGGVEYAITTQWSLRAEYRYSDFGTFTDAGAGIGAAGVRRETVQRAQVGFSYKFDTIAPVPVVARY
jgi:outer membrane immunogenic protein